jgi:hemerythrin
MDATGYPARASHRALHRAFLAEFAELEAQLLARGPDGTLVADLARWLASWIEDHVERADLELSRFSRAR